MTLVIGITGAKGAGKDTFAQTLSDKAKDYYDIQSVQEHWAYLLKLSAAKTLGIDVVSKEEVNTWADWFKNHGAMEIYDKRYGSDEHIVHGRQFLQNYGTEAHREIFGKDFWIDEFWAQARHNTDILFICDTRFENEIESITSNGGIIIYVENEAAESIADNHASESLDYAKHSDYTINNDGSIDDLIDQAEFLIEHLKRRYL